MTVSKPLQAPCEANRITRMLDHVFGADRFDRGPVDIARLAREYSAQIAPETPIHDVEERDIPGCMGALVYSPSKPRQWGIAYHRGQSPGRRAFTIGHEFGHYILHRQLIETDPRYEGGITCDEESVLRRNGKGIEKEADSFAATLLMPLHDFRTQIAPRDRVDFERIGACANRYGVSLTAAILRWLEYTETRALMIVSTDGFAHWARSSDAALKSGLFIRTSQSPYELPARAIAGGGTWPADAASGIEQPSTAWGFDESCVEMCLRSARYDQEITLLHFEPRSLAFQPHRLRVYGSTR